MAREPVWRSKAAFWTLVSAFVLLAGVPSVVLVQSIQRYLRFLSGFDPGVLRTTKTRVTPHRGTRPGETSLPDMRFVEFRLHAPKAKEVQLGGDFNQWRAESLPLAKSRKGVWETLLPLPPGRYSYLFRVDGEWTKDPEAPAGGQFGDQPASVKEIR